MLIPVGCFTGWLYYCLFFLSPPQVVLRICLLCWTWWIPLYLSCVILSSDKNYSVLCTHGTHCLSSSAVFSISLRISWSVGLVLKNCLSLCLYWIVFISLSVLKDGLLYVENLVDNFILSVFQTYHNMFSWFLGVPKRRVCFCDFVPQLLLMYFLI